MIAIPCKHLSLVFRTLALAIGLSGCGYDPNQPVYDYTLNPDGFPTEAISVIKGVETDSIAGYSAITMAFGQLYSARPDLLDDPDWQIIIQRLGAQFRYKADNLTLQGFSQYSSAADLYTLAAFARPNDARSVQQRDLFEVWTRAVEDSLFVMSDWLGEKGPGLVTRLRTARAFVLDDSLSGVFAKRYLVPRMFFSSPNLNLLHVQSLDSLTDSDRAFAGLLGLNVKPPRHRLAAFNRPSIELLAGEFIPAGPGMVRAALYFIPRQKIDSNLTVALRLKGADPTAAGTGEINLDFQPAVPTSRWKVGCPAVAYRKFRYQGTAVEAEIGLYESAGDQPRFVEIEGTGARLFTLPAGMLSPDR